MKSDRLEVLQGWKEIASFLGVSARTAQKWEHELGLPVERMNGGKGRVMALRKDLRNWQVGQPDGPSNGRPEDIPEQPDSLNFSVRFRWALGGAIIGVACLFLIETWGLERAERMFPAFAIVNEGALTVSDSGGTVLFNKFFRYKRLDEFPYRQSERPWHWIGDIDSDFDGEFIFLNIPDEVERWGARLTCYSSSGRQKWQHVTYRCSNEEPGEEPHPYTIDDFKVADLSGNGSLEVVVSSRCLTDSNSSIAVLDNRGALLREYWHPGPLPFLVTTDVDGDGLSELVLGGRSEPIKEAVLIYLSVREPSGAIRYAEIDDFQDFNEFGTVLPKQVIRFPRSRINRAFEDSNRVSRLVKVRNGFHVEVNELTSVPNCRIGYKVSLSGEIQNAIGEPQFEEMQKFLDNGQIEEG